MFFPPSFFDLSDVDDELESTPHRDAPIGKVTMAPCGHHGEAIIGSYVRCAMGCDAIPIEVEPEITQPTQLKLDFACAHPYIYLFASKLWCFACGRNVN